MFHEVKAVTWFADPREFAGIGNNGRDGHLTKSISWDEVSVKCMAQSMRANPEQDPL